MTKPLLSILRSAVEQAPSSTQQTKEVRGALDALMVSVTNRDRIETITDRFWRAAGEPSPPVRVTWIKAVLKSIEAQFSNKFDAA